MIISLIAAVSRNQVIGYKGSIPWHLPSDLKRFRRLTSGKYVIFGRKTYESIGKPLPDRKIIVMTRDPTWNPGSKSVLTAHDIEDALTLCRGEEEIFVGGGSEIYNLFMPFCDRLYLTYILEDFIGDTRFNVEKLPEMKEVYKEINTLDNHPYIFTILESEQKVI